MKQLRILIIDDDPIIHLLAREALDPSLFEMLAADCCAQGLELFRSTPLDIVLLDILLPDRDGFSALEDMRDMESGHNIHVPIVMLTGVEDEASVVRAFQLGATDFISKPVNWALLPHRLNYVYRNSALTMALADSNERLTREVAQRTKAEQDLHLLTDELEMRVAQRTLALEKASRAKSEFLASMSHELRTPLNAIIGFAQLLELDGNHPLNANQRDNLQEILRASWQLLNMINGVLDMSRIDTGDLTVTIREVALPVLLGDCVRLMEPKAAERRVRLRLETETSGDCRVLADEERLRQALLNLLSNAIKFNRIGGDVVVRSIQRPDNRVHIMVKDSGPGLSDEQQSRLFQPFNRLGMECSNVEGTGIGLVLVKRILELMQGQVGVESRMGEGSTFWIELNAVLPAAS